MLWKSLKATLWFEWFKIMIFCKAHFNYQKAVCLRGLYQITVVHALYSPLSNSVHAPPAFPAVSPEPQLRRNWASVRLDTLASWTASLAHSLGGFAGCSCVSSPLILLEQQEFPRPGLEIHTERHHQLIWGNWQAVCSSQTSRTSSQKSERETSGSQGGSWQNPRPGMKLCTRSWWKSMLGKWVMS